MRRFPLSRHSRTRALSTCIVRRRWRTNGLLHRQRGPRTEHHRDVKFDEVKSGLQVEAALLLLLLTFPPLCHLRHRRKRHVRLLELLKQKLDALPLGLEASLPIQLVYYSV